MYYDISFFWIRQSKHRLHQPSAIAASIAGIDIEMKRIQTKRAMVSRCISKRKDLFAAMLANKSRIVFQKSFIFHAILRYIPKNFKSGTLAFLFCRSKSAFSLKAICHKIISSLFYLEIDILHIHTAYIITHFVQFVNTLYQFLIFQAEEFFSKKFYFIFLPQVIDGGGGTC